MKTKLKVDPNQLNQEHVLGYMVVIFTKDHCDNTITIHHSSRVVTNTADCNTIITEWRNQRKFENILHAEYSIQELKSSTPRPVPTSFKDTYGPKAVMG